MEISLLLLSISATNKALVGINTASEDKNNVPIVSEAAKHVRNLCAYKPSALCRKPSAYLEESFQFLAQLCHECTTGEMFWRSASFKTCTIEVLQPCITHKDCDSIHQLTVQLAPVNTDVCGITCCCSGQSELCLLLGRQKCSLFSETPLDLVHLHQILVYIFVVLMLNFWTSYY